MRIYFWLIRLAALCGNKKAQLLVRGEKDSRLAITDSRLGKDGEHWVWFHAASVGEFEQARPIIEKLKNTNSRF